jgi:hypothetical protein
MKLRNRTGRLDPSIGSQASRCDAAYVGLYALGDESASISRGATRFLNVESNPPRRGRPRVEQTLDLEGLVAEFVARATFSSRIDWAEPESED